MWAYLLVLLLLFSVAGGSGFPVLAETEHIEDVSTEAENMETAEMEAGETEAEEKAGKQDGQAEEQQQGDSGSDENTGKDTGEKDPDENTEIVAPGENNEAENPETTEKGQKAGNLEAHPLSLLCPNQIPKTPAPHLYYKIKLTISYLPMPEYQELLPLYWDRQKNRTEHVSVV